MLLCALCIVDSVGESKAPAKAHVGLVMVLAQCPSQVAEFRALASSREFTFSILRSAVSAASWFPSRRASLLPVNTTTVNTANPGSQGTKSGQSQQQMQGDFTRHKTVALSVANHILTSLSVIPSGAEPREARGRHSSVSSRSVFHTQYARATPENKIKKRARNATKSDSSQTDPSHKNTV